MRFPFLMIMLNGLPQWYLVPASTIQSKTGLISLRMYNMCLDKSGRKVIEAPSKSTAFFLPVLAHHLFFLLEKMNPAKHISRPFVD